MILNSPYISGSLTVTGNIITSGSITLSGSVASSSYAQNATTSSYAVASTSASYALNSTNAASASYVDYSNVANKPSLVSSSQQILDYNIFATTGSNTFIGPQTFTGSIQATGSVNVNGSIVATGQIVAQTLNVQQVTSSIVYSSGSNVFGNSLANTQVMTGSLQVTGSSHYLLGNTGIGTINPGRTLDVSGSGRFSNDLSITNSYRLFLNGSTGQDWALRTNSSTANFEIVDWGSTVARIIMTPSGNVGIGTTPSAWGSPFGAFQFGVNGGSINYRTDANQAIELALNWYYDGSTAKYINTNNATKYRQNAGQHEWYVAPSGTTGQPITFTQAMTLTAAGNLGVGTSNPDSRLHVGLANGAQFRINYQSSGDNYYDGVTHYFRNSGGNSNVMTLLDSGNVGIGTTSPKTILDVYNNADIWHFMAGGATSKILIGGQNGAGIMIQGGAANTPNNQAVTNPYNITLQRDGGNVIVGNGTDNGAKMQVNGAGLTVTGNNNQVLSAVYQTITSNDSDAGLLIKSFSTAYYPFVRFNQGSSGKLELGVTGTGDALGGGNFYLNFTTATGSTGAALKILSTGAATFSSQTFLSGNLSLPDTSGTSTTNLFTRFRNTAGSGWAMDMGVNPFGTPAGWIQARDSGNYATNTALLLNPNGGNVGIGTTSPNAKFTVSGSDNSNIITVLGSGGNSRLNIGTNATSQLYMRSQNGVSFRLGVDSSDHLIIASSGTLLMNNSVYSLSKTITGTANGTDVIFNINYGFPGAIAGTVEVFAMAGIVSGGSISSRLLTFNFAGANNAAGSYHASNVSNSVLGTVAASFSASTSIDNLSASITSASVNGFNISISNTISGTQVTAPTYYIRVTYGLHANATLS